MSECNPKKFIRDGNPSPPVAMAFAQSINSREPIQAGRSHCGRSASSLFHQQRILDAGAGWDAAWALVDDFGLDPCNILCMDQSAGMLRTAAQQAAKRGASLRLCGGEIEAVPAASRSFDGIMANHVLYHVREHPTWRP